MRLKTLSTLLLGSLLVALMGHPAHAGISRDTSQLDLPSANQQLLSTCYDVRYMPQANGDAGALAGLRVNIFQQEWLYLGFSELAGGTVRNGAFASPFLTLGLMSGITGSMGPLTWDLNVSAGPRFDPMALQDETFAGGPEFAMGLNLWTGFRLVASAGYWYTAKAPKAGASSDWGITQTPIVGLRIENKQLTLTLPAN